VWQVREDVARLRRSPARGPERIAAEVARVLRRQEEARLDPWHEATGGIPPRRAPPDTSGTDESALKR